jgi:hypothetical protein
MLYRTSTCAALLLGALAASGAAQRDTGGGQPVHAAGQATLSGTVLDAVTGSAVRAARVRVPNARVDVYTDEAGRFSASVAPGTYGAMVSMLGYKERAEIWEVPAGGAQRTIRLEPDAVMLEGLTVRTNRLEHRVRASGISAMALNRNVLITSSEHDAAKVVREMAHVTPVNCSSFSTAIGGGGFQRADVSVHASEPNCLRVRGAAIPACVLIDDSPSSFGELGTYRPQDLYRVEVFGGGRAILAYTTEFAENMVRTGYTPPPVEAQIEMYCRKGPSLN